MWLPANVSLHESTLTIATSEGTKEFRPHRLAWQGQSQFSVSGLDHTGRLSRVVLRFKAVEDANGAAAVLLETGLVIERPLVSPAIEIAIEMPPQFPLLSIVWMALIVLVVAALFPRNFNLGTLAVSTLGIVLILLVRFPFFLLLLMNRRQQAWIRQEGESLQLETLDGSFSLVNVKIEWSDSNTFNLRSGRHRWKLFFRTREDALAAIQLLKTKSAGLETIQL